MIFDWLQLLKHPLRVLAQTSIKTIWQMAALSQIALDNSLWKSVASGCPLRNPADYRSATIL